MLIEQLSQPRLTEVEVDGVRVGVSTLERVLWPATDTHPAVTKRDLLLYFVRVSDTLLGYVRDRPLALNRFPTGIRGKHFFQKHVETRLPPFVDRECLYAEQHAASGENVICNNLATLIWLGQMANLELHPWHSRTTADAEASALPRTFGDSIEALEASVLNYPDTMVFDLDSYVYAGGEREPTLHREGFRRTCEAALWLKDTLDQLALRSFVKTSGKTGLHIFVPILRQFDYDAVREISGQICRHVLRQHPTALTVEWTVENRRGKVFLDYNQNTRGKTLASAYSPRAVVGATVSMPVEWDELDRIYPAEFTILHAHERLEAAGDVWRDMRRNTNDLSAL